METNEAGFDQIVSEAFAKINQFSDGNILFYQKFNKSRAVISTWKSGKAIPPPSEILRFISVSNEVIKECLQNCKRQEIERTELLKEFQSLVSMHP